MAVPRNVAAAPLFFLLACSAPADPQPLRLLGNPIRDAQAALAKGDSTYLAIELESLVFPGLAPAEGTPDSLTTFRLFSQRSLGVSDRGWQAQRDSLTVYAVAYNWTVRAARVPPSTRPL